MPLYLKEDLVKAEGSSGDKAPKKFEQKGGKYVARVQVGYDKDSKPRYRYFETHDEYQKYLADKTEKQATPEAKDKKLKHKVEQEHAESTNKTNNKHKKHSLYVKHDSDEDSDEPHEKEDKKDVKKSISVYIVL